jgi:S1-C subfamily serine protease
MRNACLRTILLALGMIAFAVTAAAAQSLEELLSAVVHIKTFINPDGRTVENLGRDREGTGIVIDNDGLILTIGYLMVEAYAAEVATNDGHTVPANVVGYDHESGFGLLRAIMPLKVRPIVLGRSASLKEGDPVVIASYGGPRLAAPARVVAKREFAGGWEYLLDEAIFTAPPHPAWSGAALLDHEGNLVGVGSLIVGDASGRGDGPGNMFVPIDRLPPILGDLIADGRTAGPGRPWLGLTTSEAHGRLIVTAVTPGGPAEKAGLRHGDIVVGVGGAVAKGMADFYREIYAQGAAGTIIPLAVRRDGETRSFDVKSMNRLDHLKLKSTF